jgi:hypothetical protein
MAQTLIYILEIHFNVKLLTEFFIEFMTKEISFSALRVSVNGLFVSSFVQSPQN